MRTLASTFSTRDEAEAASRRLEAIGISRERIILKDVTHEGGATGGGVFVSVKVTTEQVQPVNEILKSHATPEATPGSVTSPANERPLLRPGSESDLPRPPGVTNQAIPRPVLPPESAQPQQRPERTRRPGDERARLGRYVIFYALALVGAFVIGAWLGLLS